MDENILLRFRRDEIGHFKRISEDGALKNKHNYDQALFLFRSKKYFRMQENGN